MQVCSGTSQVMGAGQSWLLVHVNEQMPDVKQMPFFPQSSCLVQGLLDSALLMAGQDDLAAGRQYGVVLWLGSGCGVKPDGHPPPTAAAKQ